MPMSMLKRCFIRLRITKYRPHHLCVTVSFCVMILSLVVYWLLYGWPYVTSSAPSSQQLNWWQQSIIYQIYPSSFQDSNGDGIGDLNGIVQRLDYLRELGVGAIWLNPIYPSPMKDNGYDVSNYTDINPIFGTLNDFDRLLQAAHNAGLRVVVDFVPNHCSDQHVWFQLSRKRVGQYYDYFIWVNTDPVTKGPPNNWRNAFGGSAWTWDGVRNQYYYHSYLKEQPDLNWRDPNLVREMHNVLRFWLDRGVDGFRVDAIGHLYERTDLSLNEPDSGRTDVRPDAWQGLRHDYTMELQPDLGDAVRGWRKILEEYEQRDGIPRFLVAETHYNKNVTIRNGYYDYGASMPFNFDFTKLLKRTCNGRCLQDTVRRELDHLKPGQWPNFVLGSHDITRIASKMGAEFVDVCNMLLLLLPGTPTTYYGEELGMHNVEIPYAMGRDVKAMGKGEDYFRRFSRDPYRTPMQWVAEPQAGFTSSRTPWLPLPPDATERYSNVQGQQQNNTVHSHLETYRQLAQLRQHPSFLSTNLRYAVVNDNVFSFIRFPDDNQSPEFLVAMNFGTSPSTDDYSNYLPGGEVVLTTSENIYERLTGRHELSVGSHVSVNGHVCADLTSVTLNPGEGFVVKVAATCHACSVIG